MHMRNNIPGLVENLKKVECVNMKDSAVIGQATVYLAYLYDILSVVENKQEKSNEEFPCGMTTTAKPIEPDNTKWYATQEWYLIYDELYDQINDLVKSKIRHLPEWKQTRIVDLLQKRFAFEYPGDKK